MSFVLARFCDCGRLSAPRSTVANVEKLIGDAVTIPLRDRDDLPEDVARVLAVRRHKGNPWTDDDALVVADFCGFTPTEPWPGWTGTPWAGVCKDGHVCSPKFSRLLKGHPPCSGPDHAVGRWRYVPLRERDDLPPEVRSILHQRRSVSNPWTDRDAREIARFAGYDPSDVWPGSVSLPWPGVCEEGHDCRPYFSHILKGRPPCGRHHRNPKRLERVDPGENSRHFRNRADVPPHVVEVLRVPRSTANPWTEAEARVVAEFAGFFPTSPWPGRVSLPWRGKCAAFGHDCAPRFDNVMSGQNPCQECGWLEKREEEIKVLRAIAAQRGDAILDAQSVYTPGGRVGRLKVLCLTVRFACGHISDSLAVRAGNYKNGKKGCSTCNPNKLVRGVNDLVTLRPDIADQIAVPWDPARFAVAGRDKVEWSCGDCGHRWQATLGSRTILKSGCPECNGSGGYDEAISGTLYVIKGVSKLTREVLVKVGISNVPVARLYRHHRQGLTEVLVSGTWSDGSVPVQIERYWKWTLRASLPEALLATKADLPDGYREAVKDSDEARLAISRLLEFATLQSPDALTEWSSVFDGPDERSTSLNNALGLLIPLEPHP